MNLDDIMKQFTDPVDVTDQFAQQDISDNQAVAALGCFPILFWVPLVSGNSPFAKFYANQGLTILIMCVATSVISAVLGLVLGLIPILGAILSALISLVLGAATFAAFLFGIINALNGRARPIPVIGTLINPFR